MSDLQGNLQEIRRLVEQSEKAYKEREKTLQAQKLENLRDSFARIVFDHALSDVDFIDQKSGKLMDGDIAQNIADIAYDFADACMISRMCSDVPSPSSAESSLAETFTQLQHAPSEDHHKSAWHQGPPPVRDDGTIILVKIDTRSEGWPFVVRCWARGVTTVSGSEWAYPSVAAWCEIPK